MNRHAHPDVGPRLAAEVGLGLALVAALVIQAAAVQASWGAGYWWFDITAGSVVGAIALVRRWHPGWAAGLGLAIAAAALIIAWLVHLPAEPGVAMTLALAVLLGSAVRTRPPLSAAALAAAGLMLVLATVFVAAMTPSGSGVPGLSAAGWLIGVGCGLALRFLRSRREAVITRVRSEERLDLARELHDAAAHHLTGIVVEAQAGRLDARRHDDPQRVHDSFQGIETAGSEALAAIRRVVGLLRDTDDDTPTRPGVEALPDLVARFNDHAPAVHLHMPEPVPEWPPEVGGTVHRVAQEALTNIARHAAHVGEVRVTVTTDEDAVTVDVTDDAPARPVRPPRGYGLIGMRERVEALGGTLRVGPRPQAGWSVVATLPLPRGARR